MVQREGRLIRQGNQNPEVFIYRYITEGSFDSYSWQLLESKQKFISSFLEGTMDESHRSDSDIADTVLSYAEAKALAIGDSLIKTRVETANRLERLRIAQRQRRKRLLEMRDMERAVRMEIKKNEELILCTRNDINFYRTHRKRMSEAERRSFGEELLAALADNVGRPSERLFDWYQKFQVLLPAWMPAESPSIILIRQQGGARYTVRIKGASASGISRRIDQMLVRLPGALQRRKERLALLYRQLDEVRKELSVGNPYDEMTEKTAGELKEIDRRLHLSA